MKPLSAFRNRVITEELQELEVPSDAIVAESEELNETDFGKQMDPPLILMLRRQAIRVYPDKTKVALYFCQKLNKYFTVPYETGSVIGRKPVAGGRSDPGIGMMANESLDDNDRKCLEEVFDALSEDNKAKYLELMQTEEGLQKALEFAKSVK